MNAIKERKIVYTSGQIAERVRAMAAEIDAFYGDEPLVAVCVLKGAVFFFTDLVRAMRSENLELDFVRLSSYGKGTSSSRHVVFSKDVDCDITGKHVLIVEDVVDSGLSMQFLMRQFEARGARQPASGRAGGQERTPRSGRARRFCGLQARGRVHRRLRP